MEQELKDQGKFKDFYQFTFNFAKNPGQKGLGISLYFDKFCHYFRTWIYVVNKYVLIYLFFSDLEMAIAYWNLILAGRFKFLDLWNKFLLVSVYCSLSYALTF